MRAKIAGVAVAFAVLLGGGLVLAVDDENPAQGANVKTGGPTPEDCRPVDVIGARPC